MWHAFCLMVAYNRLSNRVGLQASKSGLCWKMVSNAIDVLSSLNSKLLRTGSTRTSLKVFRHDVTERYQFPHLIPVSIFYDRLFPSKYYSDIGIPWWLSGIFYRMNSVGASAESIARDHYKDPRNSCLY